MVAGLEKLTILKLHVGVVDKHKYVTSHAYEKAYYYLTNDELTDAI